MSPVDRVRRSPNATAALLSVAIVRVWDDLLRGGAPWRHDLNAVQPLAPGGGATTAPRAVGTVAERRDLVPACNVLTVAYVARSLALVSLFGGPGARTSAHAVGDHVHRPARELRTAPLLRRTELARAVTGRDHRYRARSLERDRARRDHRAPRRVDDHVERDGVGRARRAPLVRVIVLESWDASRVGELGVVTQPVARWAMSLVFAHRDRRRKLSRWSGVFAHGEVRVEARARLTTSTGVEYRVP